MSSRNFENELGNDILIDVSDMDGGVLIVMEGPDSSATNCVTEREAEMLREALNDWASNRSKALGNKIREVLKR